jgi:hypothetical protein
MGRSGNTLGPKGTKEDLALGSRRGPGHRPSQLLLDGAEQRKGPCPGDARRQWDADADLLHGELTVPPRRAVPPRCAPTLAITYY